LELLVDATIVPPEALQPLWDECVGAYRDIRDDRKALKQS